MIERTNKQDGKEIPEKGWKEMHMPEIPEKGWKKMHTPKFYVTK